MQTSAQCLKNLLTENGVKQSDIARRLGVRESVVSQVVAGRISSARIVGEIARVLNITPEQVKAAIPGNGALR